MRIIAITRDSYADYFRRGLLDLAIAQGIEVLFIGFDRGRGKLVLSRNGDQEQTMPLYTPPWKLRSFLAETQAGDETVIINSACYNWFWNVLFIHFSLPGTHLIFDVYDWLYYDAKGIRLLVMKTIDKLYRLICDDIIVTSHELLPHYPGSFLLENASYVMDRVSSRDNPDEVVVVASFDTRLDITLMQEVLRRLPEVGFHLYGRIRENVQASLDQLIELPNVTYHGAYKNADLETILKPYSIGLIPYAPENRINRFVNPEKVYHYLQAGMEVVSTPIHQARRMQEYIHLAATADEFIDCINRLRDGQGKKNHPSLSMNFHWSARWKELLPHLNELVRGDNR